MTKRSYRQHCALARALDVVGERWTLLLVRELLTGPRRYKELMEGLAGMGTNLLAARLRELRDAGLIESTDGAYALTERGTELEEAVLALARFGAAYMTPRQDEELWRAQWNVVALKYAFRPERAPRTRGVLEYRVDDSCVQARLRDGEIETAGEARWKPDVVIRAEGETFLALAAGELVPDDAEAAGKLVVEGDRRLFRTSLRAFGI